MDLVIFFVVFLNNDVSHMERPSKVSVVINNDASLVYDFLSVFCTVLRMSPLVNN